MSVGLQNEAKSPTILPRIDKLLSLQVGINPATKKFLLSLKEQFGRTHHLTPIQYDAFQKIESANTPEAVEKSTNWNKSMTDEMREDLRIMANFYKQNASNFHKLADLILQDENFIVTEDIYKKMVLNKYAQKVLVSTKAEPKFKVGESVEVSFHKNTSKGTKAYNHPPKDKTLAMVVEANHEPVSSAVKGGKKYLVVGYGKVGPLVVEERHIKPVKQ